MDYPEFFKEWHNPRNYIIVHTSGSTGKPKEIKLQKNFVAASANRTIKFFDIKAHYRLHSCVSPDFIGGKMMAVRAELAGCGLTWETPSNRPFQELSSDDNIHLAALVPSQMEYVVNNLSKIPKIDNYIVGGAPVSDSLRIKIASNGLNAYETYGMTETASHIALRKITVEEKPFNTLEGISVSLNESGCLVINFESGENFVTNDLGILISPTQFYISGRADHIINTGGRKVNPFDIEKKLEKIINSPFVITSLKDDKWGERIILVVEGTKNTVDSLTIENGCKSLLEPWQRPKEIRFIEKLPRTPNGKISRDRTCYFF